MENILLVKEKDKIVESSLLKILNVDLDIEMDKCFTGKPIFCLTVFVLWQHHVSDMLN